MSNANAPNSGVKLYRRLLSYVPPYWKSFALAILGMITVAATEPTFAALMKPMLDGTFVDKDPNTRNWVLLAAVGVFIARGIGGFLLKYYMAWVGRGVIRDLRQEMFQHFMVLSTSFYDRNSSGHLTSKLIYDVEQVASAATSAVTVLIRDSLTIIGLVGWMLYLSWKLTLFFVVIVPIITLIITYVSKRFRLISKRIQASMGDVSQITQQVIEGNRVVKIYSGEQHETQKFKKANEFNRKQQLKMAATGAASVPVTQLFAALALVAVLSFATNENLMEQSITVGTFMSFVVASMLLLPPMKKLTEVNANLQRGIAAAQSIFSLIDEKPEIDNGQRILNKVTGDVKYSKVSFAYDEKKGKVIDEVNIDVASGQTVAIVGRSGSGKSTLVSLLARFYEVSEGEIILDGVPINSLKLNNLRHHLALVSQEIVLFNDTIANNIAYACGQEYSEQEIIDAATAAHAMEFISELPDGLQTVVGEKGVLISGGQRQRIAIARALLKDAPILILDEATSALDSESERHIQEALNLLMSGRTTLVIAHRLSTIENADCIIVLDNGKIVEQGTHTELLAMNSQYAALHKMQFQEYESSSQN